MRQGRAVRALLAVGIASLAVAPDAAGATYIVDQESSGGSCSDVHSIQQATWVGTPWCSLRRAVGAAPAGSVVAVRGGLYPPLAIVNDGSRETYLTLRPYGSERVVVGGFRAERTSFLRLQGVELNGAVVDHGAHHIELLSNRITPKGVVLQDGVHDVLIEGNHITAPTASGVHFSSAYAEPEIRAISIRANHFENVGVVAVNARNFRDLLIDANEFEGVHSWNGVVHPDVIRTYQGGSKLVVRRNFIHDNSAQGFFIKDGRVFDVTLENNVIAKTTGGFHGMNIYDVEGLRLINNTILNPAVFQGAATGVVMTNNIFASLNRTGSVEFSYENYNYTARGNLPGRGPNDLRTGITFVDPANLDYRLAPGSAGIDAGTSLGAPSVDRLGGARVDDPLTLNLGGDLLPYYDIGAHEYGSGPVLSGPTLPVSEVVTRHDEGAGPQEPASPRGTDSGPLVVRALRRGSRLGAGKLVVRVRCAEACRLEAWACLRVHGSSAPLRSDQARRSIAPGPSLLRLTFAKRTAEAVRRTLRLGHAVKATIRVTAWGETGQRQARTLHLRLSR